MQRLRSHSGISDRQLATIVAQPQLMFVMWAIARGFFMSREAFNRHFGGQLQINALIELLEMAECIQETEDTLTLTALGNQLVQPLIHHQSDSRRDAYPNEDVETLEREARGILAAIRASTGDLGNRVRQVLGHVPRWEKADPDISVTGVVSPEDELAARAFARCWVERDFLVDPELPAAMSVVSITESPFWRVELRERTETRTMSEGAESYHGQLVGQPGPVLPVWEYNFPLSPEIEAGERRERLPRSEMIGACLRCNGTGHRACAVCDGKGFVQCPICHGRTRIPCQRCRGRGRIADAAVERRARASKGYLQVQAERLSVDAGERLADFAERLRQDHGVPLPPFAQWTPHAPASGETIPCPDCVNGTVACNCGNGKWVCQVCHGTAAELCPACAGSGRVLRYREIVRRFDTQLSGRVLERYGEGTSWLQPEMVRECTGEIVWEGNQDDLSSPASEAVPEHVWVTAQELGLNRLAGSGDSEQSDRSMRQGECRMVARRVRILRVPVARIEYVFAGRLYSFVAGGFASDKRFWAEEFPVRWSRAERFFEALARDLSSEHPLREKWITLQLNDTVSSLDEFRARRAMHQVAPGKDDTPESAPPSVDADLE